MNIVCFRDDLGQNGWQDTPYIHDRLETLFDSINYRYSHSVPNGYTMTCPPSSIDYIVDTRIRWRLNHVYFFNNTTFNGYWGGDFAMWQPQQILDWLWSNYPETRGQVNHIMTMPGWGHPYTYQGYSPPAPYQGHLYVHSNNLMLEDWPFYINHLCHEYGHLVGLHHTYDHEYQTVSHYDFLDDVFGQCVEPLAADASNPCFANCGTPNQPCPCTPVAGQICYLNTCNYYSSQPDPDPFMGNGPIMYYISPKSAGRMHRALSIFNWTFRLNNRPMQQYVDEKYPYPIPYEVAQNERWDFAIKMYQDIVVKAGATLTIACEVRMPIDGRIIVEPGAHLVIDGGVVTKAHNERWWGIEVQGQSGLPQYTMNQGVLDVKNDGVIEFATTGAFAATTDGLPGDWSSEGFGGIIRGTDGIFRNNIIDVQIPRYHWITGGGSENGNRCRFTRCSFITDGAWPMDDQTPYTHAWLWDINSRYNNTFIHCRFANEAPQLFDLGQRGWGILGYDAGFNVEGNLDPAVSVFEDLTTGVVASAGSAGQTYRVNEMVFTNNWYGILDLGSTDFRITKNQFELYDAEGPDELGVGVFLDGSERYTVEQNTFDGPSSLFDYGIYFDGNTLENDQIMDNVFNDLLIGTVVNDKHAGEIIPGVESGLQIRCGDYTANYIDEAVFLDATYRDPQGFDDDIAHLAGNRFYTTGCGGSHDLWIDPDNDPVELQVAYYHHDQSLAPDCTPECAQTGLPADLFIDPFPSFPGVDFNKEDHCVGVLDQTSGGGHVIADVAYRSKLMELHAAIDMFRGQVDQGEKVDLLQAINQNAPWLPSYSLRDMLLLHHPLSDEVMRASLKRVEPMDPWHLTQIFIDNSPLEKNFRVEVEQSGVLSPFFLAVLSQFDHGMSTRRALAMEVGRRAEEKARLQHQLLEILAMDTVIPDPTDSITMVFANDGTGRAAWHQYRHLVRAGDYPAAAELEEEISRDPLSAVELDLGVLAKEVDGDWSTVDPQQQEHLLNLASRALPGSERAWAIGLLLGLKADLPPAEHPDLNRSSLAPTEHDSPWYGKPLLGAYPNPARDQVRFVFPPGSEGALLRVFDPMGREVLRKRTEVANGLIELPLKGASSGIYLARLEREGFNFGEVRFTVVD